MHRYIVLTKIVMLDYNLTLAETARLNPHPKQLTVVDGDSIIEYEELLCNDEWLAVGHIPLPHTRLGWLVWHIIHGLLMKYPVHKVVGYALTHTKMEIDG